MSLFNQAINIVNNLVDVFGPTHIFTRFQETMKIIRFLILDIQNLTESID